MRRPDGTEVERPSDDRTAPDPPRTERLDGAEDVPSLALYGALSRIPRLGYGGKIMLVAFLGTHVPLLGLVAWLALGSTATFAWPAVLATLVATLVGTAATLLAIHHLLRPIGIVSRALGRYLADRTLPALPRRYTDAVGTLMADTDHALERLDETVGRLEHLDPVTGLANRERFLVELDARAARSGSPGNAPFPVCAIAVHRFDEIVSAFGRARADRVLRRAARCIEDALGPRTGLARIDAGTFACLPRGVRAGPLASALEELDAALAALGRQEGGVGLGCRAGVALCPRDGADGHALLDAATSALGVATRTGRTLAHFSSEGREAEVRRHELERDLHRALDGEGGLELHYQPVVETGGGTVVGVEALVRWHHPRHGTLAPDAFVPLAERSELIGRLGRWTLETACAQLAAWRRAGTVDLKVAVNLSARQLGDGSLPDDLARILSRHGIRPGSLELELTETAATGDLATTGATLARLRELGVSIAIDDFGTGHSSMSRLRTLRFDRLKIDREFVRDVATNGDHRAICGALIALARELELEVLAEGTETSSEVEVLRGQGCDVFQGFYFHRPMPAAALEALLAGGRVPFALG